MKKRKFLSLALSLVMAVTGVPFTVGAVSTIPRETSRTTETLKLSDGTSTGVTVTQINFTNKTGGKRIANIAEADLSDTHLSIEAMNGGTYLVNTQLTTAMAQKYSNSDRTVLCAVNGDLWMTGATSTSSITKKVLQTTRGIFIVDREVWATQEIAMETGVDNQDPGSNYKAAFGVTSKNQPLVGVPVITVDLKNETRGTSVRANGLNRLPANNAIIVYNNRCYSTNYALNDSYEIEIEASSAAFTLSNKVTGKVKAIYDSGSTTRPSIGKNTIVITARGSRVSDVSSFKVGDTVSFDLSMYDRRGNTALWNDVTDAIGGHIQELSDGYEYQKSAENKEYPSSLIGIKDDGKVMICTVSGTTTGSYVGLNFNQSYDFMKSVGYRSAFFLDGGGSATFVTLKDGTYTVRNNPSDSGGAQRAVINGIAICWNKTPVCASQGSLDYITTLPDNIQNYSPVYLDGSLLRQTFRQPFDMEPSLTENDALKLTVNGYANDPNGMIDFSKFGRINLSDYPYLVMRVRSSYYQNSQLGIFFTTDGGTSWMAEKYVGATIQNASAGWHDVVLNLSGTSNWNGVLERMRLDPFNSYAAPNQSIEIAYIAFAQTSKDTLKIQRGTLPDGAIPNYRLYSECGGSHTYTASVKYLSDTLHKATCAHCGYISEVPHVMTETVVTPATCISGGVNERHCAYCSYSEGTITTSSTSSHTLTMSPAKDATCTEDGYTASVVCSVCGFTVLASETIPAKGHSYSNGVCSACGDVLIAKGDVNGDTMINAIDANLLRKIVSGHRSTNDTEFYAADLNSDGNVNAIDANVMTKVLIGKAEIK